MQRVSDAHYHGTSSEPLPESLIDFLLQDEDEVLERPAKRRRKDQTSFLDDAGLELADRPITVDRFTIDISFNPNSPEVVAALKAQGLRPRSLRTLRTHLHAASDSHGTTSTHMLTLYLESSNKAEFLCTVDFGDSPPAAIKLLNGRPREYSPTKGNVLYEVLTTLDFVTLPHKSDTIRIAVCIQWDGVNVSRQLPLDKTNAVILKDLFPDSSQVFGRWTFQEFYESVHVPRKTGRHAEAAATLKVPGVACKLYPFQKRTVRWLMEREGVQQDGSTLPSSTVKLSPRGLFKEVAALDGSVFHVSTLSGAVISQTEYLHDAHIQCDGGLLAEEMGLGKTVEILALIDLHQRGDSFPNPSDSSLVPSKATVIVSPVSIQQQWRSEIELHSPHLEVMIYEGMRSVDTDEEDDEQRLIEYMRDFDVVLVSYTVLSGEVHYAAEEPDRRMRHAKKYRKRKSPLVAIEWWRCILDECQMIEGGLNQAALVAHQIPRRYSWAVSGTPMKKTATDLAHIMDFLRLRVVDSPPWFGWSLLRNPAQNEQIFKPLLDQLFHGIALRHTKDQIRDELVLPPQKRIVITMPFSAIEEQRYTDLYQEMCDECGLSTDGTPLSDKWDPERDGTFEKMRTWLARLRQTILHPEVGERNRKALGRSEGPLRTVGEVLKVMTVQNETATRLEERLLMASKLRRGQILEHARRPQEALDLWAAVLDEARCSVEECRREQAATGSTTAKPSPIDSLPESVKQEQEDDIDGEAANASNLWRLRLRSALEILHIATFFVANAFYQIKSNEEITKHESEEFKTLELQESEMYEKAKAIRKEMLSDTQARADIFMKSIKSQKATEVPRCEDLADSGGLESRHLIEKAEEIGDVMNMQKTKIDAWREAVQTALLATLIDQEDEELQGDEYETSTKHQDEVYVYIEVLRALIADRHELLTGQPNALIDFEMRRNMEAAKRDEGHSPPLMIKLLGERLAIKPNAYHSSFRNVISELRSKRTSLETAGHGSKRAGVEREIVTRTLESVQKEIDQQTKSHMELEKELELFMSASNARLDFYRQLQTISDSVAPFEEDFGEEHREQKLEEMVASEAKIEQKLQTFQSRGRYLTHLNSENDSHAEPKHCIICRETIDVGLLTSCGHQFCKDCLKIWWNTHKTCPVCKKSLSRRDFHQISYKPPVLTVQEESNSKSPELNSDHDTESPGVDTIYSGMNINTLAKIQNIDLSGSYGTKIDTLARHILYLRQSDPGAKSIIFSQFRDFLDILGRAFKRFRIGFASVDERGRRGRKRAKKPGIAGKSGQDETERDSGIERFLKDPGLECFLLHARAQAAGLNLVNATHVFLCEPLINTALELQAIARVHRIGQHQPTTVYMYLVDGTVEKAIYDISVRRRLEHVGSVAAASPKKSRNKLKDKPTTATQAGDPGDDALEVANSQELQQASLSRMLAAGASGGELVPKSDLWECLFRVKVAGRASDEAQRAVAGFLGGEVADERRVVKRGGRSCG